MINQKVSNNNAYSTDSNYRWYYRKIDHPDYLTKVFALPDLPSELPVSDLDVTYEIKTSEENRIDIVAFKFYKEERYKDLIWVLMLYNNILDPYEELSVGTVLYIPDLSTIEGKLI